MRIINSNENKPTLVSIKSIYYGTLFKKENDQSNYYMLTRHTENGRLLAVNIVTGTCEFFHQSDFVIPVNSKTQITLLNEQP